MNHKTLNKLTVGLLAGCTCWSLPVAAASEQDEEAIEIHEIVTEAKRMAEELKHNFQDWRDSEPKKTTYMGVVIESVPDVLRDYIDLPDGVGLLLTRISRDGPAMKAGLVDNDILVSFDGQIIINYNQLSTLIDMKGPGASVPVKVLRKGTEMEFTVVLEERIRKGGQFIVPDLPEPPLPPDPGAVPTGLIMERIEEWIPGSVQVFIDENEQVHVDLQDLKNDLQDVRLKLLEIRESGDAAEIIKEFGDYGARTTVVHAANRSINYNSKDGHLVLNSTEDGEHVMVMDPEGSLIYQGDLPEDYQKALPERAVRLIDALKASEQMLDETNDVEYEIQLTNEAIEPVTVVLR